MAIQIIAWRVSNEQPEAERFSGINSSIWSFCQVTEVHKELELMISAWHSQNSCKNEMEKPLSGFGKEIFISVLTNWSAKEADIQRLQGENSEALVKKGKWGHVPINTTIPYHPKW